MTAGECRRAAAIVAALVAEAHELATSIANAQAGLPVPVRFEAANLAAGLAESAELARGLSRTLGQGLQG